LAVRSDAACARLVIIDVVRTGTAVGPLDDAGVLTLVGRQALPLVEGDPLGFIKTEPLLYGAPTVVELPIDLEVLLLLCKLCSNSRSLGSSLCSFNAARAQLWGGECF
jgi:hypothetical protein